MAQVGFCLNGQPCNSWTRVTAGTDAPGIRARTSLLAARIFRGDDDAARNVEIFDGERSSPSASRGFTIYIN